MSTNQTKINYYDLILESLEGRIEPALGRDEEYSLTRRILNRDLCHHLMVYGPSGVGKTAFVRGLAPELLRHSQGKQPRFVEIDLSDIASGLGSNQAVNYLSEVLRHVPAHTIVFIDEFGSLAYQKPQVLEGLIRALKQLITHPSIRLIFTGQETEMVWLSEHWSYFKKYCTPLKLDQPQQLHEILKLATSRLTGMQVIPETLTTLQAMHKRFPKIGTAPGSLLRLLDDATSLARLHRQTVVSPGLIHYVTAAQLKIPLERLHYNGTSRIKALTEAFETQIVGQRKALAQMSTILKRSELGLKNTKRPRGSFLVLGPSGVGKTETAKVIAESLFGNQRNFVRFDMSEFSESHTNQRLIGAPPGYVGFDAGGELTKRLEEEPDSLVLLDEIEKAHPKIFDIFLQVLDDGRITSGSGKTIDCTNAIFYATSNIASALIVKLWEENKTLDEAGIFSMILPELQKYFRTEFINRFDAIIVFTPLDEHDLMGVAKLEIKKIQARSPRPVAFTVDEAVLRKQILNNYIPALGARPIKRFVENVCESLIVRYITENADG